LSSGVVVRLDDDAVAALWSLYDATGVRPEYVIPVLYLESGFNPSIANAAGAPYYGIGQNGAGFLAQLGTSPAAYLAMSQGQQIRLAITPYYAAAVKTAGGSIRSATRAYQANFLPATLPSVRGLTQIVARVDTAFYSANRIALDPLRHGAITLSDLALVMARSAAAPEARDATARAYAMRPTETRREAVYGQDFIDPWFGMGGAILAALALSRFAR
jgi:hypothetical protein